MSDTGTITIHAPVRLDIVHNAIIGAFEGASTYWLRGAELMEGWTKPDDQLVWWGHRQVISEPFKAEIRFDLPDKDEGNGEGRKTIGNDDLGRALALMFEKSPKHFADLIAEQDDATTHDVFMQYLVLGEVVYG